MGLFDVFKGAKMDTAEQNVLQKMVQSELLDWVADAIVSNPEARWMSIGDRGDRGWRKVWVIPSGFCIEVPGAYEKKDEANYVAINFERAGYAQLDSAGGISRSRMCYLYATALQRRMSAVMPNCKFGTVSNNRDWNQVGEGVIGTIDMLMDAGARAEFTYDVPVPAVSKLF